ncbi:MAG: inosine/xanthosine triphosphatase [Candidatus Woesearchaeota archaeon]
MNKCKTDNYKLKKNNKRNITINIGTKNPSKINAVKEAFLIFDEFKDSRFNSVSTSSGVSEQPTSLSEVIKGAKNRAKNAFNAFSKCNYGVGLESGLMKVSETNTGYFDICVCAIYDGKKFFLGLGPGIEFPKKIIKEIISNKMNASDAALKTGLTKSNYIGYEEGLISILTKGAMNRKEYHKYSVIVALAQIVNKNLYI